MADKKDADGSVSYINKGQRHFDVKKDGKAFRHSPNMVATYTAKEAEQLSGYPKEIFDISKLPGAVDTRALKADNAKLLADNAALKAQLDALTPKGDAIKEEVAAEPELAEAGPSKGKRK